MENSEQEVCDALRKVRTHERQALHGYFVALLSTLIGSILAFTSLFDWSGISTVFEKFGSLSDGLKITLGLVFGVLIVRFVYRSLDVKMSKIEIRLKKEIQEKRAD